MKKDIFFYKGEYLCVADSDPSRPRSAAEQSGDFEMVTQDVPDELEYDAAVTVKTVKEDFNIKAEAFGVIAPVVEKDVNILATKLVAIKEL